jgi:hypothetical protein
VTVGPLWSTKNECLAALAHLAGVNCPATVAQLQACIASVYSCSAVDMPVPGDCNPVLVCTPGESSGGFPDASPE